MTNGRRMCVKQIEGKFRRIDRFKGDERSQCEVRLGLSIEAV